jgi:tripartite-type tricarboxylate transporter receptor subunit TctC
MKAVAVASLAAALCALPCTSTAQQKYPVKAVRLLLPFTSGSAVDVLARTYAQALAESWGQQVIVDNRAGANGIIGMEAIARAPADGYTLGMGNIATLTINPSLYPKLGYDPLRDYAPVAYAAAITNCLIVHPSLPVRTVRDLVALAKSRPGQINYASGGVGSAQHIPMELLASLTGVKIMHVAYKGLTPAFNDVVAGHVPMMISGLATALPHHRNGRIRIVGTTGATRAAATPDLPTIAESVAGFEGDSWTGFLAPAGTPADIITRINAEVVRIGELPATRERLSALGF